MFPTDPMPPKRFTLLDAWITTSKARYPRRLRHKPSDEMLVLLDALEPLLDKKIDKLPARWPDGYTPQHTARPTAKRKRRE